MPISKNGGFPIPVNSQTLFPFLFSPLHLSFVNEGFALLASPPLLFFTRLSLCISPMSSLCFFLFLFLCFPLLSVSLEHEVQILQSFKRSMADPNGALSSWHGGHPTPCSWAGILCDGNGSVISVDLPSKGIAGPFPSHFCQLEHLLYISFFNNSINSVLPPGIVACTNLEYMDIGQNLLTGSLPSTIADLPNLRYLDVSGNNFSGEIPPSFGRFQKLEAFSVILNLIGGQIPPALGNITTLRMLNLSYNPFEPGTIPPELGNLENLEVLWLTNCNLEGQIPASLGRLKRLVLLDLSMNRLSGSFPLALTGLSSVTQIELFNNSLSGELPSRGFSNLKSLRLFDASMNHITGSLPEELCGLPLESLNVFENRLEGSLPENLGNSMTLAVIKLFGNKLTGALPKNLGKFSPLRSLDLSDNHISGELPHSLCAKGELVEIMTLNNNVSGEIPASLGECRSLTRIRFANNRYSGLIPENFWGLPNAYLVELANNSFSGSVSPKIANAKSLGLLLISHNNFSGKIPEEIGHLENLVEFSGDYNNFIGHLPVSITKLKRLGKLNLQSNKLSGLLSSKLEAWEKLNELNLAKNNFSGMIPPEIAHLAGLNYLDLSSNQFSGEIPTGLQNLNLNVLNLSYNHLSGRLPSYFETAVYKNSFLGNPELCREEGAVCETIKVNRKEVAGCLEGGACIWLLKFVFILAGVMFIVGAVLFHVRYRKFLKTRSFNDKSKWTVVSFHKLSFNEDEILGCLEEDNVIGSGGSGQVYKVALGNGEIVAVKKLWAELARDRESIDLEKDWNNDNGFDAEVKTLGKIRHKNIVKLWCCCTNGDSKLLVYEYMPNGSLGDMLHGSKRDILDWPKRYKIALDAADGLSYLHHDCIPPIVHRDVKSNNILLDAHFGARIADFGVAVAIDVSGDQSMSVVAGSCGYIAPEYAYTLKVKEKSDIYSYGMVILELVTGRHPTNPEFEEKDLVKWVCSTLEQKGIDHVIDPKLDSCFQEEILKVLNIGLLCSSPLPVNRPPMRIVVALLQEVRTGIQSIKSSKKDRRLSPCYEDGSEHGNVV